ncbi:hypothetical protein C6T59_12280 [Burkholderia multivorans]|nr:hypothetical protein C6P74_06100 [Burkholderia multivorans]PRE74716.1 hypothetical protein C6Q02_28565 [Burkholderia multivorans]PRF11531.1 hypothetical protein C6Q01_08895 [Burkholderia multivorans]PRF90018.1 hypothetical protein C6Q23_12085 [Burkholderia multivorans]PRG66309.1 hypothetical protein C6T59_12280 [Burkholderia multivorans]
MRRLPAAYRAARRRGANATAGAQRRAMRTHVDGRPMLRSCGACALVCERAMVRMDDARCGARLLMTRMTH